jgi:phosphoribosylanthranilate isomerase
MGRVRVKICGLTSAEDARSAVEAGADAVGLVFAESPRQVDVSRAAKISRVLPPWVTAVGVFVNAAPQEILETARAVRLGAVQFHGEELPCTVEDVAQELKVIKAFRIGTPTDLADAEDYVALCRPDACLIDSRVEGAYGGSGRTAPWLLAARLREEFWPLILSGGLTPANVAEAIERVRPFGVDVSSGVESSPGRKDAGLVREFIQAARSVTVDYPPVGDNE